MTPKKPERAFPGPRAWAATATLFAVTVAVALTGRPGTAQVYVPTADLNHPKVRYADSLVSLNDRCPVRTGKLSTTYKPVYVNHRPIGFC
jgi:hypothetical protein